MRVTGNWVWAVAGLVAISVWPSVAFAASTVSGTVTFEGKAPPLKPLSMDALHEAFGRLVRKPPP